MFRFTIFYFLTVSPVSNTVYYSHAHFSELRCISAFLTSSPCESTHEKLVVTPLQNWRNLVQAYSVLWRLSPSAWKCLAKGKVKVKAAHSCLTLCDPMEYSPWNSPGQNTAVGSCSLLQWIFPTQASNPGLPHCRQILYHQGSPAKGIWLLIRKETKNRLQTFHLALICVIFSLVPVRTCRASICFHLENYHPSVSQWLMGGWNPMGVMLKP